MIDKTEVIDLESLGFEALANNDAFIARDKLNKLETAA